MIRPRVLGHRALVKPLEANEATEGGIVLPDVVKEKETRGLVVAVGSTYAGDVEPPVAVGDVVVYADGGTRHFGAPVRVSIDQDEDGRSEEFVVVEYADLLLVLDDVRVRA